MSLIPNDILEVVVSLAVRQLNCSRVHSFVLDAWQYFWHRYFHVNKFLYKHVHSVHHRLYVPYAYGALYNHPVEGFVLDTLGAVVAQTCAFMTIRQSVLFFVISTAKTVDDHGGYVFKWDPFQLFFANDVAFHNVHRKLSHRSPTGCVAQIVSLHRSSSWPEDKFLACVSSGEKAEMSR